MTTIALRSLLAALTFSLMLWLAPARAADVTPSFASVPVGWVTDRRQPDSFSNIGCFQAACDVLGIGIGPSGSFANRPAAFQSTFYNTQGMQTNISGGAGDFLRAYLFVPASWGDHSQGSRRTDMWGVVQNGANVITDYPIVGFTNYGGAPRFRGWSSQTGSWTDFAASINYDGWNSVSTRFTGTTFEYYVNDTLAGTVLAGAGADHFSAMIMQAYNFGPGDASIVGAVNTPYVAMWANEVPEPATYLMMGLGLLALLVLRNPTLRRGRFLLRNCACNVESKRFKALFNALIPAVNEIRIINSRSTFSNCCRKQVRQPATQVRTF